MKCNRVPFDRLRKTMNKYSRGAPRHGRRAGESGQVCYRYPTDPFLRLSHPRPGRVDGGEECKTGRSCENGEEQEVHL